MGMQILAVDAARDVFERLRLIAANSAREAEAGRLLIELRGLVNGKWTGLLRELRPGLKRPDAWAHRCMAALARHSLGDGGCRADAPTPQEAFPLSPPDSRRLEEGCSTPSALDERASALYSSLRPLLDLAPAQRAALVPAVALELGKSEGSVWRLLRRLKEGGAAALNRKPRADRGEIRAPEEVKQFFLRRRLDPLTRTESIASAALHTQREFASIEIALGSLRRLARTIPAIATMPKEEWRKTFLPQGRWEAPYPNHTHTFDFTRADVWCWDGDEDHLPYRPWLTTIIDEHSRSLMWGLYTEETPSRVTMQSVLLRAWLPKATELKWPQHGLPTFLHCDNGKVQASDWLDEVCRTLNVDLGEVLAGIRHTEVYSGFQQGKVERAHGIIHDHYERNLGLAYCGGSPQRRPEDCPGNTGGPKVWQGYPTLESLNYGFRCWATSDYHQRRHRTLKMSRQDAWLLRVEGRLRAADEQYLYTTLLQRAGTRLVHGTELSVNTFTYWHERLQGYHLTPLEVRWDPSDLSKVLVLDGDGQPLLWADRREPRIIGNPKDIAEWREDRRRVRQVKRAVDEAAKQLAPADQGVFERALEQFQQEHEEQVIPFPRRAAGEAPTPPPDLTADEILSILPAADPEPGKLSVYGLEI